MDKLYEMVRQKVEGAANRGDFGWLGSTVVLMGVLFIYWQVAIGYTHGSLVGTLAMVEDTNPTAILRSNTAPDDTKDDLPPYTDDPDAPPPSYTREEVLLLSPTPITASNRGTVRHLQATCGGRRSRFRGLGLAIGYALATHYIAWCIHGGLGLWGMCGASLSFLLAQLALFRVNMLWTHVVISAPSDRNLWRRLIPWKNAKRALLPTLGWALAHLAIPTFLIALIKGLGIERLVHKLDSTGKLMDVEIVILAGSSLLVLLSAALLMLVIYVPANVALTRCQAALLDESETAIVPFDRTFGGTFVFTDDLAPQLRLKHAWRSFDWNGRIRLAKVYVKTVCFQALSTLVFVGLVLLVTFVWALIV